MIFLLPKSSPPKIIHRYYWYCSYFVSLSKDLRFPHLKNKKEINKAGTTILLVEQNVRKALEYADRAYVFKIGTIAFEGMGKELMKHDMLMSVWGYESNGVTETS